MKCILFFIFFKYRLSSRRECYGKIFERVFKARSNKCWQSYDYSWKSSLLLWSTKTSFASAFTTPVSSKFEVDLLYNVLTFNPINSCYKWASEICRKLKHFVSVQLKIHYLMYLLWNGRGQNIVLLLAG